MVVSAPRRALFAVVAAARVARQGEVPQYFSEAAASAVKLAPHDPRLPSVLAQGLAIDNYQLQKSVVERLMKIDSDESRAILRTVRERLPREYSEQLVLKLLDHADAYLREGR